MKIEINGKPIWVNYHHLYCFYVIASSGTLTEASKRLGVGQSALSIQMKQFENQLGYPLFERSHRKLVPNERGRAVLSYSKEIFRLGVEMIENLHDRDKQNRIHIQIGVLDMVPKHLTVALVDQAIRYRSCSVSVVEGKPQDLMKSLFDHQIDLVVTNTFPNTEAGLFFTKRIARLPLWIVGGKKFIKLKKNFPASLENQPFVLPTADSRTRHEFESFCKKNDIHFDMVAESQDIIVQKLLAISNLGLTIVPKFAVNEYLKGKQLYLIGELKGIYEELFIISASRQISNPVASYLMENFILI